MLPAMQSAGASIVELGIPFSDPIADGPVIQASMTHALDHGVRLRDIFSMVRSVRDRLEIGLVAMVSYSIVHRIGLESFVQEAKAAGIDGFIFPDLSLEESEFVRPIIQDAEMTLSLLIAPTTPDARAEQIAQACVGFIYVVARTGITGERADLPTDLTARIERLREVSDLPITVGFGVSQPDHVAAVTRVADAAIVGTAVVRKCSEKLDAPPEAIAAHVGSFINDLARGLD